MKPTPNIKLTLFKYQLNFNITMFYTIVNGKFFQLFSFKEDDYEMFNTITVNNLDVLFDNMLEQKNSFEFLFYDSLREVSVIENKSDDSNVSKNNIKSKINRKAMILSHASHEQYNVYNSISFLSNTISNLNHYIENKQEFMLDIFKEIFNRTDIAISIKGIIDWNFQQYKSMKYQNILFADEFHNVMVNDNKKILFGDHTFLISDSNIYSIPNTHELYKYNPKIDLGSVKVYNGSRISSLKREYNGLNKLNTGLNLYSSYNDSVKKLKAIYDSYKLEGLLTLDLELETKQFFNVTFNYPDNTFSYEEIYTIENIDIIKLKLFKRIIEIDGNKKHLKVIDNIFNLIDNKTYTDFEYIDKNTLTQTIYRNNLKELNINEEINKNFLLDIIMYKIRYYDYRNTTNML